MARWIIRQYQRGLLYVNGRFVDVLEPGRYSAWPWQAKNVAVIDMRETSQTVEAQEILTSDKIGVRVSLVAQFRVVDPVAARHQVENFISQLYQDLQLTLRETISGQTLEELMNSREALSTGLHGQVAARCAKYGVELSRVGVKDIVLPGAVRSVFLQEMEAELKGRASLVAARHEVAAVRARANTARLLQENPHLLRMQELELVASLASKSGNVIVIPGLDRILSPSPVTNAPVDKT